MSRDASRSREMRQGRRAGVARLRGAAALLLALTVGTGCTALDNVMVAIFGRSMRDSRSLDPYEYPVQPADNAIPFAVGNYPAQIAGGAQGLPGSGPYAAGLLPEFTPPEMAPPGSARVQALVNPVPADQASLERGRVVYERNCAVCHGAQGLSAEAPILPKLPLMAAWNLATGNPTGYSDGYIFAMIREGRGAMPAYGHRIPHMDRWHVVNYVRFLQGQGPAGGGAPAAAAPATDTAAAPATDPATAPDTAAGGTGGGI